MTYPIENITSRPVLIDTDRALRIRPNWLKTTSGARKAPPVRVVGRRTYWPGRWNCMGTRELWARAGGLDWHLPCNDQLGFGDAALVRRGDLRAHPMVWGAWLRELT
jgi:hypothetical protein